jgi:hypothetical protein
MVDGSLPAHSILYVNLLPTRLLSTTRQLSCLGIRSSSFRFLPTQTRFTWAGIAIGMPGISILDETSHSSSMPCAATGDAAASATIAKSATPALDG